MYPGESDWTVYHNQVDQLEKRLPIGEGDEISQESSHRGEHCSHECKAFGNVFYCCFLILSQLHFNAILRRNRKRFLLVFGRMDVFRVMSMSLPDGHVTLSENATVTAVPTA